MPLRYDVLYYHSRGCRVWWSFAIPWHPTWEFRDPQRLMLNLLGKWVWTGCQVLLWKKQIILVGEDKVVVTGGAALLNNMRDENLVAPGN